jgi:hypothetical protein
MSAFVHISLIVTFDLGGTASSAGEGLSVWTLQLQIAVGLDQPYIFPKQRKRMSIDFLAGMQQVCSKHFVRALSSGSCAESGCFTAYA